MLFRSYNEDGTLIGTKNGLVFDENYFLVEDTETEEDSYDYVPEYIDLDPIDEDTTGDVPEIEEVSTEDIEIEELSTEIEE